MARSPQTSRTRDSMRFPTRQSELANNRLRVCIVVAARFGTRPPEEPNWEALDCVPPTFLQVAARPFATVNYAVAGSLPVAKRLKALKKRRSAEICGVGLSDQSDESAALQHLAPHDQCGDAEIDN